MANLKERVTNLLKTTTSTEVKAICEGFLKEAQDKNVLEEDKIAETLFLDLKKINANEATNLLLERDNLQKTVGQIEMSISKSAAESLKANWDTVRKDRTVSNVGNNRDLTLVSESEKQVASEKQLLEKLQTVSEKDAAAKSYVDRAKTDSYGVSAAIDEIKNGKIYEHYQMKYIIGRIENKLNSNTPEHMLVREFLNSIDAYRWDPTVQTIFTRINDDVNAKAAVLEVQNAMYAIVNQDKKNFFGPLVHKMNEWISDEKRNTRELSNSIKEYMFNPIVKALVNNLALMENAKGTAFNIPVKQSNCSIEKIYSPILVLENNGQIFKAGNSFYHDLNGEIRRLSEAQVKVLPADYAQLCEYFFNPSVKVVNDVLTIYVGKNKVELSEGKAIVDGKSVEPSSLGNHLVYLTQQTIFRNDTKFTNLVHTLYENLNNICEVDFGKLIASTVYEGVGAWIFKKSDKIYVNKVNPAMNEDVFLRTNAIQTVNLVKEFLSFDMSESLSGFLEGEFKKKAELETQITEAMSNIQLLEGEINKIEKAIEEDPSLMEVSEITEARNMLESTLGEVKSEWLTLTESMSKMTIVNEDDEEEEIENMDIKVKEESKKEDNEEKDENGLIVAKCPVCKQEDCVCPPEDGGDNGTPKVDAPKTGGDVADAGFAGAAGAQTQATTIPGNDHIDAVTAAPSDAGIVDSGSAGAAGTQSQASSIPGGSDAIKTETPAQPVLTAGGTDAQTIASSPSAEIPVTPSGDTLPVAPVAAATPASDSNADAVTGAPDKVSKTGLDTEEGVKESLGIGDSIKVKGTDKTGKITAKDGDKFEVLLDGGETGTFGMDQLEGSAEETEDALIKNEVDVTQNEKKKEEPAVTAAPNVEEPAAEIYVKATINMDFGPYKNGDQVEIDAGGYTAAGDDDMVKLKDPNGEVTEVPKKYLKAEVSNAPSEISDVKTKLEKTLADLAEIETMLQSSDKIGTQEIEDARTKIKSFADALGKEKEKTEEVGALEEPKKSDDEEGAKEEPSKKD